MKQKFLLLSFLFCAFILSHPSEVYAQEEKTIKLIVSGDANTKEEAAKNALRSAIEQAFGTFVSANTEILNDEVIKDEIATISSGNIQSYKVLSCDLNNDSTYSVTLETVVSIGKLVNFTKSKGATAELSGATFAMNMKIRELNKKNEALALKNLETKLKKIYNEHYLFDYKLSLEEPYIYDEDHYGIIAEVSIIPNQNFCHFWNTIIEYFEALSLTEEENATYQRTKMETYKIVAHPKINYDSSIPMGSSIYIPNESYYFYYDDDDRLYREFKTFYFRNSLKEFHTNVNSMIIQNQLFFSLVSNLGLTWRMWNTEYRGNDNYDDCNYHISTPNESFCLIEPFEDDFVYIEDMTILYPEEDPYWHFYRMGRRGRRDNRNVRKDSNNYNIKFRLLFPKDEIDKLTEIVVKHSRPFSIILD